jgi:hypothetical protein
MILKYSNFFSLRSILIATFCAGVMSCSKDDGDSFVPPVTLKIGDTHQGGIVFYVDASGQHGLIASTADQSRSTPWWNGSFLPTSAASLTDGAANTTSIIQAQGSNGTYAAKLCRDFRGGGYTDWYLPSKDQLNRLYLQKTLVGGFADEIYWSSTEVSAGEAWVQYFLNGLQHLDNTSDGATVGTRAIRAF